MTRRLVPVALFVWLGAAICAAPMDQGTAPPAPGDYLTVGTTRLWYEECGSGPSVVLLHDGLVHSITWDDVWAPLCAKYHVVRYDRRGYGRSDAATAPFVPEDDLVQIMRHVKMTRALIVGSSSGSGLALDFALAHPDMVDGLFLIGPVVHGMSTSQFFADRGNRNNAPLDRGDVHGAAENWSKDRFQIADGHEAARKRLYDALVGAPQNLKVAGGLEIRPSPPSATRLSEIQAPTVVLVGAEDIADVHAYAGAIEAALPVVVRLVWADAGHLVQLERPADLVARFDRFAALAGRPEVAVPAADLQPYAGRYRFFQGEAALTIAGARLVLHLPGLADQRLFAASPSHFFLRTLEVNIEFERDAAGRVLKMVILNSDGSRIECARL